MSVKEWKRQKFASELVINPNPCEAALAAGYENGRSAYHLLAEPETQALIREKLDEYEITNDKILRHIAMRAFSNIDDLMSLDADGVPTYDLSKATREQRAAVAEVTVDETGGDGDGERRRVRRVRIKMQDSLRALELLARNRKLLIDRVEVDIGDNLAARLGGARHRTLDATPDAVQVLIDTHTQEHVLTSNDMNALTEAESTMSTGTEKTISDPTPGGVAPAIHQIPQAIFAKLEDAGIVKPAQPESPAGLARLGMIAGDGEQAE